MGLEKPKYVLPKRSQKSLNNDPDVLLLMGSVNLPLSPKGEWNTGFIENETNHPLKSKVLAKGWRILDKDVSTKEGREIANRLPYMEMKVSRSAPCMVMRRSEGYTDADADAVIEFLSKNRLFVNRGDVKQFDPISEQFIGDSATRGRWFEDMRKFRKRKMSENQNTIKIGAAIERMEGNEKMLRDTLFLIGETPGKNDTAEDLYFQLSNAVIDNPNQEARRNFVNLILSPTMKPAHIELLRLIKKSVEFGVIQNDQSGYYVFKNSRIGVTEQEMIQYFEYDTDSLKTLKVALANATGEEEDEVEAHQEASKVNGSGDTNKGIAWVSDRMRTIGLHKNPSTVLKFANTIEEAVDVFNKLAKEVSLPKDEFLTVKKVMDNI